MPTPPTCSPVSAAPVAVGDGAAEVSVAASEPVLAGHYPGLPILPGVCLVEYARLAALAALPGAWRMTEIDSARFQDPVRPGDRLALRLDWSAGEGVRRCSVTVATERGVAARIRLSFEDGAHDRD